MNMKQKLGIYKLHDDVLTPKFATIDSACFDLHAYFSHREPITFYDATNRKCSHLCFPQETNKLACLINPGERVLIPTGIIFDIPTGYSIRLHPRSGISLKTGITLANAEGIIDSDYVEPTYVMLINTSKITIAVINGDRICQAELIQNQPTDFEILKDKPKVKTNRTGGFGSTGS